MYPDENASIYINIIYIHIIIIVQYYDWYQYYYYYYCSDRHNVLEYLLALIVL